MTSGLDVLYLFANFTPAMWSYWVTIFTICSIFCLVVTWALATVQWSCRNICKQFLESFYDYFTLIVDAAPFMAPSMSATVTLWTALCIGVYYGIHMVFMSTLSADLSAPGSDKFIDKVDDLLEDETFKLFRVTIMTHLNTFTLFSAATIGSKPRRLLERSIKQDSLISTKLEPETALPMMIKVNEETGDRTRAIIEDAGMADLLLSKVMCQVSPNATTKFVKSNEPVYDTATAMVLSHSTPTEVVNLFAYRSMTGDNHNLFN